MDTTSCIDNTTWEQYSKGGLSKAALAQLNTHVLSCEICADIKEGIDAMKTPTLLMDRVGKINAAVDKKTTQKSKTLNRWYIALAAALLLITGLTWYVTKPDKQQNIAMVDVPVQQKEEIQLLKSTTPAQPKPAPQQKNPVQKQRKTTQDADNLPEDRIITQDDVKPADSQVEQATSSIESGGAAPEEDVDLTQTKSLAEPPQAMKEQVVVAKQKSNVRTTRKSRSVSSITQPRYKPILTNEATNKAFYEGNRIDSIRYFSATALYANSAYDSCVTELLPLTNEPSSNYYESGLLLIAKSYIALNKKAMAIPYLQRVIGLNGKYRNEAETLLKKE